MPALLSEADFPTLQNTPHTTTDNTNTDNTYRLHHSNTHGHNRPHAVYLPDNGQHPGSDPETANDLLAKAEEDLSKVQEEVESTQVPSSMLEVALQSAKHTPTEHTKTQGGKIHVRYPSENNGQENTSSHNDLNF